VEAARAARQRATAPRGGSGLQCADALRDQAFEVVVREGSWSRRAASTADCNGRWTLGVSDLDEWEKATAAYAMAGITDRITCPTLVLEAENDPFFKGQTQRLLDELTCQRELIAFREDEGAGEHCHEGALSLFHQRPFDWLDTVLAGRRSPAPVEPRERSNRAAGPGLSSAA